MWWKAGCLAIFGVLAVGTMVLPSPQATHSTIPANLANTSDHPPFMTLQMLRTATGVLSGTQDFETFVMALQAALQVHQLPQRAIEVVLASNNTLTPKPACHGWWFEFGVFKGDTLRLLSKFRNEACPGSPPPHIYGFDTFTGLPEDWRVGDAVQQEFRAGHFSLGGQLPQVPGANLMKGLFNESLPRLLAEIDAKAALNAANVTSPTLPSRPQPRELQGATKPAADVTYIHVDCDLYQGAIDVLTLLNERIAPDAILIFDDLINYKGYRDHEIKALWEWLNLSGRSVRVIGAATPKDGRTETMALWPWTDFGFMYQSVAFQVV